jgi:hypothetical protein
MFFYQRIFVFQEIFETAYSFKHSKEIDVRFPINTITLKPKSIKIRQNKNSTTDTIQKEEMKKSLLRIDWRFAIWSPILKRNIFSVDRWEFLLQFDIWCQRMFCEFLYYHHNISMQTTNNENKTNNGINWKYNTHSFSMFQIKQNCVCVIWNVER